MMTPACDCLHRARAKELERACVTWPDSNLPARAYAAVGPHRRAGARQPRTGAGECFRLGVGNKGKERYLALPLCSFKVAPCRLVHSHWHSRPLSRPTREVKRAHCDAPVCTRRLRLEDDAQMGFASTNLVSGKVQHWHIGIAATESPMLHSVHGAQPGIVAYACRSPCSTLTDGNEPR